MSFIFATGIENSIPLIHHGKHRLDEYATCRHYENWRRDFELVLEMGIKHLRYGPPLHTTWLGDGKYDWTFADETFADLRAKNIIPIVDLCHFGLPNWLGDFQNRDFPDLFGNYARAFAERFPWVAHYTPVNEMLITATFSARYGWWNEQRTDERSFVTALNHVVRANVLAMEAILEVRPDAKFIQSESVEYCHAETVSAIPHCEFKNELKFVTFDLNYGRPVGRKIHEFLIDNGMSHSDYKFFLERDNNRSCVMGIDYYITSEHYIKEDKTTYGSGDLLGMAALAKMYYARYGLPLMHTETNLAQGHGGDEMAAVKWLHKQWANIMSLKRDNIPVLGFTWYSLNDQTSWQCALREDDGVVNPLGLYDLDRKIRPVGEAYRDLIYEWSKVL